MVPFSTPLLFVQPSMLTSTPSSSTRTLSATKSGVRNIRTKIGPANDSWFERRAELRRGDLTGSGVREHRGQEDQ
jgi:hypothetical protein